MRRHPSRLAFFHAAIALRATCLVALSSLASPVALAATYYLNAETGDDGASGTSESTPWKTLERSSRVELAPGDRVLLAAGSRFRGMLEIDARGEAGRDIVIAACGDGAKPRIDGDGAEACVRLVDPEYVVVRGLELTNENGKYGVRMTCRDRGALGAVTIEGLAIHGIHRAAWSQPEDAGHGEFKYYGGIHAQVLRGERPSWWTAIAIRDCVFSDLGTCGISIGSDYALHAERRRRGRREPYPIEGVVIERNVFRDIARDGAIIRQCRGAVLEHNDVIRTGRVSMSNGIWFWDCESSVIRYNVGSECGVRGLADGGPFSIDYFSKDCVIEFNYSHDNEGPAFMAFGNSGTGTGTVIRGNVSYNDATAEAKPGFAAVSMISTLSATVVEGNIIIAGPKTRVLMGHHDWQGLPRDVVYRGNIFVGNGNAKVEPSVLRGGKFEGNLFVNVPELPDGVAASDEDIGRSIVEAMEAMRRVRSEAGAATAASR
jgi:hypothetical protein